MHKINLWFHSDKNLTWYQMQIAVTGMKIAKTGHATWDITVIVPKIWITEKAHQLNFFAISKSSTLWSDETYTEIQVQIIFQDKKKRTTQIQ